MELTKIYIYGIFDKTEFKCYIGMTECMKKRFGSHHFFKYKDSKNKDYYDIKILKEYYDIAPKTPNYLEKYYMEKYEKEGWKILNKQKLPYIEKSIMCMKIKDIFKNPIIQEEEEIMIKKRYRVPRYATLDERRKGYEPIILEYLDYEVSSKFNYSPVGPYIPMEKRYLPIT